MRRMINWLVGTVTILITGAEPEIFLNRCAEAELPVWGIERLGPFTLQVKTTHRKYSQLVEVARGCQCTAERRKTSGLPFFLFRFRRRYALLTGMVLLLVLALSLSRVVLVIEVEGNEQIPTAEILSQLRLCGVTVGSYGPEIKERVVANKMLLAMDNLQYFSLNLHGTRAEVIVREREPSPKVVEKEVPTHVISSATGIVTHIEPWTGSACFQDGETVMEGEVLISGRVVLEPPPYQDIPSDSMLVHAQGRVLARTWHTDRAEISITTMQKVYTGEEMVRRSLSVMGGRVNFYEKSGIPYDRYDTITKTKSWNPVGEKTLPFIWQTEIFREYTLEPAETDLAWAEELLRSQLLKNLNERMDEGQVLRTDTTVQIQGDFLVVTLLAECTEQIGRETVIDTDQRVEGPRHPAYGGGD